MSTNTSNNLNLEPTRQTLPSTSGTSAPGLLRSCLLWSLAPFIFLWVIVISLFLFLWFFSANGILFMLVIERFTGIGSDVPGRDATDS